MRAVWILGAISLLSAIIFVSTGKADDCYGYDGRHAICQGATVHLINDGNEHRQGRVAEILGDGTVRVLYQIKGLKTELYRQAEALSQAVTCSRQICNGIEIHLLDDAREDRSGTVAQVFADDWVRVAYSDHGAQKEVWRKARALSPKTSCYGSVCTGRRVRFLTDQGEFRTGYAGSLYHNGRVKIVHGREGSKSSLWRDVGAAISRTACVGI